MAARLIVNLGSSRIEWRSSAASGSAWHRGRPGRTLVQALGDVEAPAEVFVGSVAPRAVTQELLGACRRSWGFAPRELVAGAEARGVRSGYAEPASLGVDRWAAVVAAYHAHRASALIADCGTAITLDYVGRDGRHAGGVIAPGLALMRRALAEGTRLELEPEPAPAPPLFGAATEPAASGGVLAAATGLIGQMLARTERKYGRPAHLLVTGGDAANLVGALGAPWRHAPTLVLDGLELLAGIGP